MSPEYYISQGYLREELRKWGTCPLTSVTKLRLKSIIIFWPTCVKVRPLVLIFDSVPTTSAS